MSKITLILVGLVLVLMGIAGLIPSWEMGSEPGWHAVAKILIGLISIGIAASEKEA